jgi:predicted alpha/beta superfamily hydrolase
LPSSHFGLLQYFPTRRYRSRSTQNKAARIFEVSVARPSAAPPEHGYPVMYVLDPSTAFATLVDTVRNQEQMFGPVVIVGVG